MILGDKSVASVAINDKGGIIARLDSVVNGIIRRAVCQEVTVSLVESNAEELHATIMSRFCCKRILMHIA